MIDSGLMLAQSLTMIVLETDLILILQKKNYFAHEFVMFYTLAMMFHQFTKLASIKS